MCRLFRWICCAKKESPKPRSPRKSKPRAKRDGKDIVPKDNWNQFEISGKVKELVLKFKIPEEFQTVDDCLKAQKLIKKEQLGSGAFAHVYRVIDIETKDEKAVKSFKLDDRLSPKETIDNFMTELMVMTVLDKHPSIIQIYGSFIIIDSLKKQRKCYIIMELANGGTVLDSMIASMGLNGPVYQPLGEDKAKDYFSQIFSGIEFLHSKRIAHKDLKLQNILIDRKSDASVCLKITDFGLSRLRFDESSHQVMKDRSGVGTPDYMSPQVFKLFVYCQHGYKIAKLKEYDPFRADIWALGVCLYVMVNTVFPFCFNDKSEDTMKQMYEDMRNKRYKISHKYSKNYSNEYFDLIRQLFEPNPDKRIDIQMIAKHPWLQSNPKNPVVIP